MAWTYGGNPDANAKDSVRFLIGDTDPTDPLLNDQEIQSFLSTYNNVPLNAAVRCCEAIMAKFSRMCDEKVGGVSINFSQKRKLYEEMRTDLRRRIAIEGATPYAGGIYKSDVMQVNQNTNRIKTTFTDHMMQNCQQTPWISNGWYYGYGYGGCGCGCD